MTTQVLEQCRECGTFVPPLAAVHRETFDYEGNRNPDHDLQSLQGCRDPHDAAGDPRGVASGACEVDLRRRAAEVEAVGAPARRRARRAPRVREADRLKRSWYQPDSTPHYDLNPARHACSSVDGRAAHRQAQGRRDHSGVASPTGGAVIRRCIDCDTAVHVADVDECAICADCAMERRRLEARPPIDYGQAGAQHVGRMRGTRDDYTPAPPDEIIRLLLMTRRKT